MFLFFSSRPRIRHQGKKECDYQRYSTSKTIISYNSRRSLALENLIIDRKNLIMQVNIVRVLPFVAFVFLQRRSPSLRCSMTNPPANGEMTRSNVNVELSSIIEWLGIDNDNCPVTKKVLLPSDLILNRSLEEHIAKWRLENMLPDPSP